MAAAFFTPAAMRPGLMALYAFNLELARVRDVVREPLAGQMRFAWWRDQLNRMSGGGAVETPVGRALAGAVMRHALPLDLLLGLIDARSQELSEAPFATEAEFDAHATATSCAIMKLAARIGGAGDKADAVAGPAGLAFALVGTLRSIGIEAQRRRCFLPLDLLARAGIGPEDVFAADSERIRPIFIGMATRAMAAIRQARQFPIPSGATAAILPAVLARQHIPHLTRPGVDPFGPLPPLGVLTTAASLGRAAWTGRV